MMWRCPYCKILNVMEERCDDCQKQIQFFENKKGFKLEKLIVEATLSEMTQSRKEKKEQSYWVCPYDFKDGDDKIPMT